jgi:hypothetical protein
LEKEFSQENIIFWKAVEQYKKITEDDKLKAKAKEIFSNHVSADAIDPINIEQSARQHVVKEMDNPSIATFDPPQREVTLQREIRERESYFCLICFLRYFCLGSEIRGK